MTDSSVQSIEEHEVRDALAKYKAALVYTSYRNWWHRFMCWMGDEKARQAESALSATEATARTTVNRSEEHRRCLRLITSRQPNFVREQDRFLSLLD
jgi:hypothetical protein